VVHFAGEVTYNASNFLTKNKDTLHPDIVAVLCKSESEFVRTLMKEDAPVAKGGFKRRSSVIGCAAAGGALGGAGSKSKGVNLKRKGKGVLTLGSKFRTQLDELMQLLGTTEPHFVRCIKPNAVASPTEVTSNMVLDQMRCSGLQQICKVRQAGMPVRMLHADFVQRFGHLTNDSSAVEAAATGMEGASEAAMRSACVALCTSLEGRGVLSSASASADSSVPSASVWAMGSSKVFFSHAQIMRLNEHEDEVALGVRVLQGQARAMVCRGRHRQRVARLRALAGLLSGGASPAELQDTVSKILSNADEKWPVMWGLLRHPTIVLAREQAPRPFAEHEILLGLRELMGTGGVGSRKAGQDAALMAKRVVDLGVMIDRADALDPPLRHPLVLKGKRDLTRLRHLATLAQDLQAIVTSTVDGSGGLAPGAETQFAKLDQLLELADDVTSQDEDSTEAVEIDPALTRVVETARERKCQFEQAASDLLLAALEAKKKATSAAAAFRQLGAAIAFVAAMGTPETITTGENYKYTEVKEAFDKIQGEFGATMAIGDALDQRTVIALDAALKQGQQALAVASTPGLQAVVDWVVRVRELVAREDDLLERVAALLLLPDHLDLTDKIQRLSTALDDDYVKVTSDAKDIDGNCPAAVTTEVAFARENADGGGDVGSAAVAVAPLMERRPELQQAVEALALLRKYETTISELSAAIATYSTPADGVKVQQLLDAAVAVGVPDSLITGVRGALEQLKRREELLTKAQAQVQQEIERSGASSVNADGEDELLVNTYAVTHAPEKVQAQREEEGARTAQVEAILTEAAELGYVPRLVQDEEGGEGRVARQGLLQAEQREEMRLLEAVAARLELRLAIREASAEPKKGEGAFMLDTAVTKWGAVYDNGGGGPVQPKGPGKGSMGVRLPGLAEAAVSAETSMVKGAVAALKRARLVQVRLQRVAEVREKLVSSMVLASATGSSKVSHEAPNGQHSLVRLRALIVQAAAANAAGKKNSARGSLPEVDLLAAKADAAMDGAVENLFENFKQKMQSEKVLDQLRGAVVGRQIEKLADAIAEVDQLSPPPMLTVEAMAARALLRDLTMEQVRAVERR
jgi:hypothetical protein